MLFAEKEPGKPLHGNFTFAVLISIILLNLFVFVVVRVLLDLENDMDQPYIEGSFRTFLQYFLLCFSLTFCFGCWCCCCGGCLLFRKLRKFEFCHMEQNNALHFESIHKLYNRIKDVKPNTAFVSRFRNKNDHESTSEEDENESNTIPLQEIVIDKIKDEEKY
uniref:Ion transport domain-containing protein n=1 Tax=Strongyloides stercoralis TaxID=6248 RepID=A0A0K0ERX9_STRER